MKGNKSMKNYRDHRACNRFAMLVVVLQNLGSTPNTGSIDIGDQSIESQ